MNQQTLITALHHLGIDEQNYPLVALLPLIQVGWADGRIQAQERELILRVAEQGGYLHGDARRVLDGWLAHPPTLEYQEKGRQILLELVRRQQKNAPLSLSHTTLKEVLDLCHQVADAAGGIFGLFGRVEAAEVVAITQIARALSVDPADFWEELELDETEG